MLAAGTDWGSPEAVLTTLRSLLEDGENVTVDHWGNREIPVVVQIIASTSSLLARAEAALTGELHKPSTLTWIPADGWGPPTVWDVVWSEMAQVPDDVAESEAGWNGLLRRKFAFTLTCQPFGRDEDESVTVAVASAGNPALPPSHVTVDDCQSVAHWSNSPGAGVTDAGIYIHFAPGAPTNWAAVTPATPIAVGANTYLVIDSYGAPFTVFVSNLTVLPEAKPVARMPSPAHPGWTRYFFRMPVATLNFVRIFAVGDADFAEMYLTNQPPNLGTLRQKSLNLPVGGTMRTPGRLVVENEAGGLGTVMAYTYLDDGSNYTPSLRQYRTGGGHTPTVDMGLVSGAWEPLDDGVQYTIPVSQIMTGQHEVRMLVKQDGTSGGDFSLDFTARLSNGVVIVASESLHVDFTLAPGAQWALIHLGRLTLPSALVPAGSTAQVLIEVAQGPFDTDDLLLDEGWIHNLDKGALSVVFCGDRKRLRIDSPTTALTKPAYFLADQPDFSDGYYPPDNVIFAFGRHRFTPPGMRTHVATFAALDAVTSLYHYRRFHTHVADPEPAA